MERRRPGRSRCGEKLAADPTLDVNWEGQFGLTAFNDACFKGRVSGVEFLLKHPRIDVNKPQNEGCTPFYLACGKGFKDVVSLLIADPRIDVNKPADDGITPFYFVCQKSHKEVVPLLLADLRIDGNKPNQDEATPLWIASENGNLSVVQLILASRGEVDTRTKTIEGTEDWNNKTPADASFQGTRAQLENKSEEEYTRKKENGSLIATLLDSYERNPQQVRDQLRKQLGFAGQLVFVCFLSLIFMKDDLTVLCLFICRF